MSARHYIAWDMLTRASHEDERREGRKLQAEMRHRLDPLNHISENNFIKDYRLNKEAFEDLCDLLAYYTDLKPSQRVPLESKICDHNCYILSINAKFGGAAHNAFIWENSNINDYMQNLHGRNEIVWLLGDSGYPQRPWLMTPYLTPTQNDKEDNFNAVHTSTRVLIENTFGRLKNRWRCLLQDRVLHYWPEKSSKIIIACSVLHNIALKYNVPDPQEPSQGREELFERQELVCENQGDSDLVMGRALRNQLAQRLAARNQ